MLSLSALRFFDLSTPAPLDGYVTPAGGLFEGPRGRRVPKPRQVNGQHHGNIILFLSRARSLRHEVRLHLTGE